MNNFENQLDEIRIKLYEETKEMNTDELIKYINSRAKKIAYEYGIKIDTRIKKNPFQPITT